MSHNEYLKVYHFDKKIRLGINQDGGYVIGELQDNYDCYISAGVANEESFSRDFINKFEMNKDNSFAFDGTIINYPENYTNNIIFIKKNINSFNDNNNTNLSFLIEKFNNIFLKIDIEGGEYKWLLSLNNEQLNKFKQIVIEFHGLYDDSWNCNYLDKITCLEKLFNSHYIIHVHGNNHGTISNGTPEGLELTYINKKYLESPELNKIKFPIPNLDFPNNPIIKDYDLSYFPFVNL
jgi:hypothetical protein